MSDKRLAAAIALSALYGWALVAAAESRYLPPEPEHIIQVVYRDTPPEPEREYEEPERDSRDEDIDWDELDRQSDCLFEFLRLHLGWEITLEAVLAAGDWTDVLGGPCTVMEAMADDD